MSKPTFIGRLALFVGLVASAGAQAAYTATTSVNTMTQTFLSLSLSGYSEHDPPELTQSSSRSTPLVTAQQAYTDQVIVGVLNVAASASVQVSVSPGSIQLSTAVGDALNSSAGLGNLQIDLSSAASSTIAGSFTDAVAWQVADLAPGTRVYLDFSVRFVGTPSVLASAPQSALNGSFSQGGGEVKYQWGAQLGTGQLQAINRVYRVNFDGTVAQNMEFGTFGVTGYVTLGQAELLQMGLSTISSSSTRERCVSCAAAMNGQGSSSFQPGLTWNGISAARLFDGTPIDLSRLSAMSDSGVNYVTAVPEPSSALLLTLGLTAWFISRRRAFVSPRPGASSTQKC